MNNDIDTQFLCKDCVRFNQCQYYDRRKEDSYICKYFHWHGRKGEWITDRNDIDYYYCSNCGCYWSKTEVSECCMKYCPNCGQQNIDKGEVRVLYLDDLFKEKDK